jgi:hypothetical protein
MLSTTSITTTVAVGTTTDAAVMLGRAYLRTVREHSEAYAAWTDDDDNQRERFEESGRAMNRACLALVDVMVATGRYEVEVDGYNLVQPRGCCADVNWADDDAAELIFMIPRSHK